MTFDVLGECADGARKESRTMQYAVLMYANAAESDAGETKDADEARDAHDRYAEELGRSGALVAAFALRPAVYATSLRGDAITDGPFLDTKEVIPGFYVIEAPDLDVAIDIARRNPILEQGGGVEVRPVEGSVLHEMSRAR